MKLALLHGPAVSSSRTRLLNIKSKFNPNEVVVFEKGTDLQTILGNLATPSLFSSERLVILENPAEDFALDLSIINYHLSLIFWFDREVSPLKPIYKFVEENKGEIEVFPEGKEISVFPFLDALGERSKKAYLELDKLKKAGLDTQYFVTMIFYLLRSLVVTPKNIPPFIKNKLQKQRANFPDLPELYKFVLEVDYKIKSGLLENIQAEFILVNKFMD